MNLEKGGIYHIYNQGNNRRPIYFEQRHYVFFLEKMRQFLLPYGDLLAYCLMPNHFHWLFHVQITTLNVENPATPGRMKDRTINDSIGILLRSYSRALNKQNGWSGSLFRADTKAKDSLLMEFITVDSRDWDKKDYLTYCFHYIHSNPVRAGLVAAPEVWEFLSARDYLGKRQESLCQLTLGRELFGEVHWGAKFTPSLKVRG